MVVGSLLGGSPPEAQKEEYHDCNFSWSSLEGQLASHTPSGTLWRDVRRADWQKHETRESRPVAGAAWHEDWASLRRGHWTAQAGKVSEPDDGIKGSCDETEEVKMATRRRRRIVTEPERRGTKLEETETIVMFANCLFVVRVGSW